MRILFFSHYFPPEANAPASRTHENALRWVRAGHEVTVITCAPNVPRGVVYPGYRNRPRQVERIDGIRVVRVWTFIAANKGALRRILNYFSYMLSAFVAAQFEKRPDVMVATSPQFFCGWAGVLTHWLRRWPFVLEIRDIWPETISTVGAMRKGTAFRFVERLELAMYRAADHIVAVGEGYRRNLLGKGVPPEKVSVIYNGVDLEKFRPMPGSPEFRRRHGLGDSFLCGYIGTVGMCHGLEVMLDAAERTRDRPWKYLFVGDGARLDDLMASARERNLENVVFTGRLSKDEMPEAWAALDACLIHLQRQPLFQTVIPSKMFEAMGMEVPILMGVEGEAMDIVREAGAGLPVEPENAADLVAGIEEIRSRGEALGKSGRRFVALRFDRDVLAADYLGVLEKFARKES